MPEEKLKELPPDAPEEVLDDDREARGNESANQALYAYLKSQGAELFRSMAGVNIVHVTYKGTAQAT